MRQISQNLRTGKLSIHEVPVPQVQPGHILVQTAYSLISAGTEKTKIETGRKSLIGKALARPDQVRQVINTAKQLGIRTTLEKVKTRLEASNPLGYSASGIVVAVGENVSSFRPGDHVACGGASAAHAEFIVVPKNLCAKIPDGVALDEASFTTLGSIALQGISQADVRLGESICVLGLGLLGQLTVQMLKAAGCLVIGFDPDKHRCSLATNLGADVVLPDDRELISSTQQFTATHGVDAVIITAGTTSNKPVELAGELCRDKGKVVIVGAVGLTIPREPYFKKELDLRLSRSYGPGRYDPIYEEKGVDYPYGFVRWTERRNMKAFLGMLARNNVQVDLLITHRFKLDQAEAAYRLIQGEQHETFLGVLFEYENRAISTEKRVVINPSAKAGRDQLGVGVIGAGNFAQSLLLPNLKNIPQVYFSGIATRTPLSSRDVSERFQATYATTDPDEILNDPDVHAVIIATQHDSHGKYILGALEANKAVFVEKPLAFSTGELNEIIKFYEKGSPESSFVMVGFNRRFAPLSMKLAAFYSGRKEPLAMLYRINAGYIPLDHWTQDMEIGGGRIVGEICHFIDLLQFFAGSRVRSIFCRGLPNAGKYRDDNVSITLSLDDGSTGTILYLANGDKALPKEYIEVFGDGKVAVLDDFRSLTLFANQRKTKVSRGALDKGHKNEMSAWVEALRNGTPEPVPFKDAVIATQATFAALESLRGGEPILLN